MKLSKSSATIVPAVILAVVSLALGDTTLPAAEWQAITKQLIAENKPGYGGATGVTVDPKTGDLFVWLSDKGLFRSADQGQSWKAYGPVVKGRTEWPGCLQLFAGEKEPRFIIATVYGGPIIVSVKGETPAWQTLAKDCGHVDWCAVAPAADPPKFILTLKHESGDELLVSTDGGQKFTSLGKQFGPAAVFDDKTAVVIRGPKEKRHAERTTDAGATFAACGEFQTKALPQWRDGKCYWLTEKAIMTTSDQGATWHEVCQLADGRFGPIFGHEPTQMFVLTGKGIVETTDGGKTWSAPVALPAEVKANSALAWIAFDSVHNTLYAMQMSSDLYKLTRDKK